jgi:hypothetical protein
VAGGYAFNYPANWYGKEAGTDAHFRLPNNAKLEVSVRESVLGETIESLVEDPGPLPPPPSRWTRVAISGEVAIRQDILGTGDIIVGRAYHVLHGGSVYFIVVFSSSEMLLSPGFDEVLGQFEEVMNSFHFLR